MIYSIFVCINFAVFIALCVYAVKNYLLPFVYARTLSEQLHHTALVKRKELLAKQQTSLEREIVHQKYLYTILSEKIERWAQLIAQSKKVKTHTFAQYAHDAVQRRQQQLRYQEKIALNRYILSPAVTEARAELLTHFQSPPTAQKYNAHIFEYMHKETT